MINKGIYAASVIAALAIGAGGYHVINSMDTIDASPAMDMSADTGVAVDSSTVIVTVNGQPITAAMLENRKRLVSEKVGGMFLQLPESEKDRVIKENLILEALVDQNMKDSGIADDPVVAEQVREARQQVLRTAYLDKIAEAAVTDEALRAIYDAQIAKMPEETEIHARHILVKDEALAKEIIAKLKAGVKFEDLAKENSLDKGNASQGGDLGFFTKDQMVPEFANVAFAMQPGEVSQTPIKTAFGWHVVEVLESRTKAKPSFEEVKAGLQAQERQRVIKETIEKWRTTAVIEEKTAAVAETTDALETTDSPQTAPTPAAEEETTATDTEAPPAETTVDTPTDTDTSGDTAAPSSSDASTTDTEAPAEASAPMPAGAENADVPEAIVHESSDSESTTTTTTTTTTPAQ